MELFSAIFVVLLSFFTILYGYFKYSYEYWRLRGIPCDEPSIPYGTMKGFGKTLHPALFLKNIYDKYKPQGHKLRGVYFFNRPSIVLLDLDLIKDVLVKFTDRGLYSNGNVDPLSAHLFMLDGEPWKKMRANLTCAFTSGKMKFMFPTVVEIGERFRDCLFEIVEQHDELEIKDLLARWTTDVIGTIGFGVECNSLKDPNAEFRHYGRAVFEKPRHSPLAAFLMNEFKSISKMMRVKRFRDEIIDFFVKVIRETVEYREKNNVNRNDFMDILIKLKNQETIDENKKISFNELIAQAFVFFIAGFENSSSTLAFCLYELAMNPNIQETARKVIRESVKKHNGKFTYEAMMDMPYIDQILQETLRKHPPIGHLVRNITSDYQIPGTKTTIAKGIKVFIPTYAIHYDSEQYPNPEIFDPDRFGSADVKKYDLAFGDGPRNCIGKRFGMMQARVGLFILLNNFEISPGPNMSTTFDFNPKLIVLQPPNMYLKFKATQDQN